MPARAEHGSPGHRATDAVLQPARLRQRVAAHGAGRGVDVGALPPRAGRPGHQPRRDADVRRSVARRVPDPHRGRLPRPSGGGLRCCGPGRRGALSGGRAPDARTGLGRGADRSVPRLHHAGSRSRHRRPRPRHPPLRLRVRRSGRSRPRRSAGEPGLPLRCGARLRDAVPVLLLPHRATAERRPARPVGPDGRLLDRLRAHRRPEHRRRPAMARPAPFVASRAIGAVGAVVDSRTGGIRPVDAYSAHHCAFWDRLPR